MTFIPEVGRVQSVRGVDLLTQATPLTFIAPAASSVNVFFRGPGLWVYMDWAGTGAGGEQFHIYDGIDASGLLLFEHTSLSGINTFPMRPYARMTVGLTVVIGTLPLRYIQGAFIQ